MNRSSLPPQALFLLVIVMLVFSVILVPSRNQLPQPQRINSQNICQLRQVYRSEIVNQLETDVTDENTVTTINGVFPYLDQPQQYDYKGFLNEEFIPFFLVSSPVTFRLPYVAMIGADNTIDIVNITTMQAVSHLTFTLHHRPTMAFYPSSVVSSFSPDGSLFAASLSDETWVWDVRSGKQLHRIPFGSSQSVGSMLNFSPDNRWLTINQWYVDHIDPNGYEVARNWLFLIDLYTQHDYMLTDGEFSDVSAASRTAFTQDSQTLYTADVDIEISAGNFTTVVRRWDLDTIEPTNRIVVLRSTTWNLEIDSHNRYLVGWDLSSVWIIDLDSWLQGHFPEVIYPTLTSQDAYNDLTINPSGDLVAVGGLDGVLQFIDLRTGVVIHQINNIHPYIQHIEFNAEGDTLIVLDQDIHLYQIDPERQCDP